MERWVHDHVLPNVMHVRHDDGSPTKTTTYVSYHAKTKSSPTQRGVRPTLRMITGNDNPTARGGRRRRQYGNNHGNTDNNRANNYGGGHYSPRRPDHLPGDNYYADNATSGNRGSRGGLSSPSIHSGSSPRYGSSSSPSHRDRNGDRQQQGGDGGSASASTSPLKRRQTTLAEFGRTLMASKRHANGGGGGGDGHGDGLGGAGAAVLGASDTGSSFAASGSQPLSGDWSPLHTPCLLYTSPSPRDRG